MSLEKITDTTAKIVNETVYDANAIKAELAEFTRKRDHFIKTYPLIVDLDKKIATAQDILQQLANIGVKPVDVVPPDVQPEPEIDP